jgi:hypothetical protein
MAGIETPYTCDSKSFFSVLNGEKEAVRDVLYGAFTIFRENYGGPGNGARPGIRAVRKGDWKLIKYDLYDGEVHETQLFNLKENPFELLIEHHDPSVIALTGNTPKPNQVNLANDLKYAVILAEMEELLLEQQFKYNDPFFLWDQAEVLIRINSKN